MFYVRGWTKQSKQPVFSTSMPNSDLAWCVEFSRNLCLLDQKKSWFSHVSIDKGNIYEKIITFSVEA